MGHLFSFVPLVNYSVDLGALKWYSSNSQIISYLSGTCRICVIIFEFISAYAYEIGSDKTGKISEWRDMWLCQVAVLLIAFQNNIYKLGYTILIFIVAVLVTLFVSIAIDWFENKTGYSCMVDKFASTISGYRKKQE